MIPNAALEFLLVSNNFKTLTAVTEGLKQLGASFGFVPACDSAQRYIERRKLDGIFIDLEVPGALDLIQSIRQGSSNRLAVIFACVPDGKQSAPTLVPGASFLLEKPLTPEIIVSQTTAAQEMMARERRRYFRHALNLSVSIKAEGADQWARMNNLGEGGMAVHVVKRLNYSCLVEFAFELPLGQPISGKGMVAWANSEGLTGIKFQLLRGKGQEALEDWLANRQRISPEPLTLTT
jgi:response regulator RpfG family c-di-GMP phosphodiesterase